MYKKIWEEMQNLEARFIVSFDAVGLVGFDFSAGLFHLYIRVITRHKSVGEIKLSGICLDFRSKDFRNKYGELTPLILLQLGIFDKTLNLLKKWW